MQGRFGIPCSLVKEKNGSVMVTPLPVSVSFGWNKEERDVFLGDQAAGLLNFTAMKYGDILEAKQIRLSCFPGIWDFPPYNFRRH